MEGLLAKKCGMTQVYDSSGIVFPVTVLEAGPCKVIRLKNKEIDGYNAVVIAFEEIKKVNKPKKGAYDKAGLKPHRIIKEVKISDKEAEEIKAGDVINVDIFEGVEFVDLTGRSKGKGFAGVIKRHNFHGARSTHGVHEAFRHTGSIGAGSSPSRVFKGKKMPGRMGGKQVTIQNLKLVNIDKENNIILVRGAVPGGDNGFVYVKKSVKKQIKEV